MSEYRLKTPKQAKAVVNAYHKVEDTVTGGYKAIEKRFVETFLERVDGEDQDSGAPSSTEKRQGKNISGFVNCSGQAFAGTAAPSTGFG